MPSIAFANEEEWLTLRDAHIGGSDIASLFNIWQTRADGEEHILHVYEAPPEGAEFAACLSPYTSSFRIWQEKSGLLKPSFEETERVTAGKFLEPALAAWAMNKWPEWKLRKTRRYIEHDEVPGWGASFDYELVAPGFPPVEFKNVDFLIFRDKWQMGEEKGDITPPFHINLQLQTQIGLTTADHGWIVLCIGGNRLERIRVPRHQPTIDRIRTAIEMFWTGVEQKAEPRWLADFATVVALFAHGEKGKGVDLTENEAVCRAARRYKRWGAHSKYVALHLDLMKAQIALAIGDGTSAFTGDYRITYPSITREAKEVVMQQKALTYRGGMTLREAK